MNEISCIYDISEPTIRRLEALREKWTDQAKPGRDRPIARQLIEKRIEKIKADHEHLPRLLKDLKSSLDVVCHKAPNATQEHLIVP